MDLHTIQPFKGAERGISCLFKFEELGNKQLGKFLDITGYLVLLDALVACILAVDGVPAEKWLISFAIADLPFVYVYWRYVFRYAPLFNRRRPIVCANCRKLTLGKRVSRAIEMDDGRPVCTTCEGLLLVQRKNLQLIDRTISRVNALADDAGHAAMLIRGGSVEANPIVEKPPREGDPDHAIGA